MLLVGAMTATATFAGGNYLAHTGPAPLRFARAELRLDPAVVLPALQMEDKPEVSTNEVAGANAVTTIFSDIPAPLVPDDSSIFPGVILPVTYEAHSAPMPEPKLTPPPVTEVAPQMLMRFFNRDATREAIIQTPLEFTPPPAGRSSSATYTQQ